MKVKIIVSTKKVIVGILAHVLMRIAKYLKSIADTSVITYDEIISIMDIVSTKMTNTLATDVLINSNCKK